MKQPDQLNQSRKNQGQTDDHNKLTAGIFALTIGAAALTGLVINSDKDSKSPMQCEIAIVPNGGNAQTEVRHILDNFGATDVSSVGPGQEVSKEVQEYTGDSVIMPGDSFQVCLSGGSDVTIHVGESNYIDNTAKN